LADVASFDLSLAKLFEGHTDAVAVLHELGGSELAQRGGTWGLWAAEPPDAKVLIGEQSDGTVTLSGRKAWCSGAGFVSHGLMTAWRADGSGPFLVAVDMRQTGVRIDRADWQAVGMAASASVDLHFDSVLGVPVGGVRAYLDRPGFWQGGAGVAACWFGGATAIAAKLREAVRCAPAPSPSGFRTAALGRVDLALQQTAAVLRHAAAWIDDHPHEDASAIALRTRLSAEASATTVLDEAGRALGAAPFCQDARFARMAADLPVFIRQSHADRDFAALGERCAAAGGAWRL
jgi:hypothetical protein